MGQRYREIGRESKSRPRLACNLDFARGKGLEPKVKHITKIV